jgi:hypothetical protein
MASSNTTDPFIARLLAACPELQTAWDGERTDDEDEPLPYMQAAALAQVVTDAYSKGETECFRALFQEVEAIVAGGATQEQDLAIVGFLEDLQSAATRAQVEPDVFRRWLGPKSLQAWDGLLKMWEEIGRKKASGELPPGPFDKHQPDIKDQVLKKIFRSIYRPPR